MKLLKYLPYLVVLCIFISLLLFHVAYDESTKTLSLGKLIAVLSFKDSSASLDELNVVFALEAVGLISIVFLLGPLSKLKPTIFGKFLYLRKPLGLIGVTMALIHAIYSTISVYHLNINELIYQNSNLLGIV